MGELEACVICLDNSEWSRNGDYSPSRFEAQQDAANVICGSKTGANPENAVGLLTMAGTRVDVRVAPTMDAGMILQGFHGVEICGTVDFVRGIQTAQLALKNRMNKNQKQRIVAFVCSPLETADKQMEVLGRTLKKNNVSLDIVSFGEIEANRSKLEVLFNAVNSNNNCNLIECPQGSGILSDIILCSPLLGRRGDMAEGGAQPGEADFEFGVDPALDPELYMALRISMQEEESRRAAAAAAAAAESAVGGDSAVTIAARPTEIQPAAIDAATEIDRTTELLQSGKLTAKEIAAMEEIDPDLRDALLCSLQDFNEETEGRETPGASSSDESRVKEEKEEEDVKMEDKTEEDQPRSSGTTEPGGFKDPAFVQGLLSSLPGVDLEDRRIQHALQQGATGGEQERKKSEDKETKKEKKEEKEEK